MRIIERDLILNILKNLNGNALEKSIDTNNVDWEVFFQLLTDHKIFPTVYKYLESHIPSEFQQLYHSSAIFEKMHIFCKMRELRQIVREAENNSIEIVIIKGFSLSKLIYDDVYSRAFGDIDILVDEESIPTLEKMMFELGYTRILDFENEHLNTKYENMIIEDKISTIYNLSHDNHEVSYKKTVNELVEVHVEIKRATSSVSKKYIQKFLQATQNIEIDGLKVKTLDNNHTLIHLFSNTYHNTENVLLWGGNANLRDYFDIYNFLLKFHQNIDLDILIDLCNDYNITYKVIYILKNLNELFSDNIIVEFIKMIEQKGINIDSLNSIVQWKNSFLDRIFSNKSDILHEFNRLLKKRCYSSLNKNHLNYYDFKESQYINFFEKKYYKYSFLYKFSFEENNLTLSLKLSEELYEKLGKFKILWRIMDNGTNVEITYKDFLITKNDNKIISDYGQVNFITYIPERFSKKDLKIFRRDNNIVEMDLTYALDEISIDISRSNNLLCYNIILLEEVLPEMNQNIETQFSELNMGIIKFP